MAVRGASLLSGGGSTFVNSVSGTANEITVTPTTGAVVVSLPVGITLTGKTVTGGTFASPIISGTMDAAAKVRVRGNSGRANSLTIDKAGSTVNRYAIYIGDGTVGTADDAYFSALNTMVHFQGGGAGLTDIATLDGAGAWTFVGNHTFTVANSGIVLKQGANGLCGTFVANGATPVSVNNTNVAITDAIIISLNTVGGVVGVQPHIATITGATGFTVVCTATDTSTYNYAIIKNAA